jgi:LuxR family transcriptional regulator, maltose regulon positive regulatory protein
MSVVGQTALPRVPSQLLPRPSLAELLDRWSPITVVTGPPGFGKTTLVTTWMESQSPEEVIGLWASLDVAAASQAEFLASLSTAFFGAGVTAQPLRRLGDLGGALAAVPATRRVVLVIDNFQHVRDEEILRGLVRLVELHRHFHLVVCSRGWHAIESFAAAHVDTCSIDGSDLSLSMAEVGELGRSMGARFDDAAIARLQQDVGGWMSALRLVFGGNGSLEPAAAVADYVRTVVLPELEDSATVRQIMRFSLADRLELDLVRDLCGDPNPDRYLARLEATGLFERVPGGRDIEIRLPLIVRGVLRQEYAATDARGASDFHRRLGSWYARHEGADRALSALRHAVAGADWALMSDVWARRGATLAMSSSIDAVRECFSGLPDDVISRHPVLLVGRMVSRMPMDEDATANYRAALNGLADVSMEVLEAGRSTLGPAAAVYVAAISVMALRMSGRLQESDGWAVEWAGRFERYPASATTSSDWYGWFHLQWGLTRTLIGDERTSVAPYERAWARAVPMKSDLVRSGASACLALTYAMRGNPTRARAWLDRYHTIDRSDDGAPRPLHDGARVALALLALDRLDRASVDSHLAYLGHGSFFTELWPYVAFLHAQHAVVCGAAGKALAELDDVIEAHGAGWGDHGPAMMLLHRARADLLVACGQGQRVRHLLGQPELRVPLFAVPLAHMHLAAGEHVAAMAVASRALWGRNTRARDRFDLFVIKATAAVRTGDRDVAADMVRQAFALYRETGILRPFVTPSPEDLPELFDLAGQVLTAEDLATVTTLAPRRFERVELIKVTKRERSLLLALETTASRQEIANQQYVSLNTVKAQLNTLYRKLGSTTREEALARAHEFGLLP